MRFGRPSSNKGILSGQERILSSSSPKHYRPKCISGVTAVLERAADVDCGAPCGEAILCHKFVAHTAAIASAVVVEDSALGKQVITTSLDKSVAMWTSQGGCNDFCGLGMDLGGRIVPQGGPAFSVVAQEREQDRLPAQVFLGMQSKSVLEWGPPSAGIEAKVNLANHCGWVRGLAIAHNRWLFSCACNTIKQWDISRAVPSEVATVSIDKGDILCLEAGRDRLFAATVDGTLRSWRIGRKGELADPQIRFRAHSDRIVSIALCGNILYTVGYDGSIKSWDAYSLGFVLEAPAAHDGARIHCVAVVPTRRGRGMLFTGGDDNLIRRWDSRLLTEAMPPLHCHTHSVRVLSSGQDLLLSGDSGGEVAIWKI